MKILFKMTSVIVITIIAITLFFIHYLNTEISISDDYYLYIQNGDNFRIVANNLKKDNIIKNKNLFIFVTKILKKNKIKIYAGEFKIEKNSKIINILNSILNNKVHYRSITFAEGLSTNSIIKILNNEKNLIGELNPKDFEEGIYLPETYKYVKGNSKISVLNRMKTAMDEFINSVWDTREINKHIKNKEDLLKLASIVEKETSIDEERNIIASVFLNRLDKKMKLQTDPSVIYSFTFGDTDLERRIKKIDLLRNVPYNTYKNYGLTPTPICNPGKKSIMAVLHPAKTDYLYFVASEEKDGRHKFSKNYKTHRKFVKEYVNSL